MLRIVIKEGESIERAVKRYRRKVKNVKLKEQIRERKHYTKKSDQRRKEIEKSRYREAYLRSKEE